MLFPEGGFPSSWTKSNLPTWGGCNKDSCLPQCWCFISFRWWHGRQLATATPGTWAFPSCCGRPKLHQPSRCLPGHNTCSVDHTGDGDMARATWVARVGSPRSEGSLRAWRIWRNLVKIHETWKTFLISPKPCRPASSQKKAFTIPSSSPSWILWWGTCAPRSLCVTWVSTPRRSTSMSLGWLEGILWETWSLKTFSYVLVGSCWIWRVSFRLNEQPGKMKFINAYNGTDFTEWYQDKHVTDAMNIQETSYETLGMPEGSQQAIQYFNNGIDCVLKSIEEAEENDWQSYIYMYTAHPDKHMHELGIEHPEVTNVLCGISDGLQRLWDQLRTLDATLLVTADHGHVTVEPNEMIALPQRLLDCLEHLVWKGAPKHRPPRKIVAK